MAEVVVPNAEPITKSDILDALNVDDDSTETEDKPEPKDKDDDLSLIPDDDDREETSESEDDEDDDSEDKEDEDEDFEYKDEDDDKLQLSRMPRRAEIKAAYPDIFKKFPALDNIVGREKAFSELFSTVADAKEAQERVKTFNEFEGELLSGNLSGVLKSVKGADEKAYKKIVGNYFKTLNEVDPAAHLKISNDILKSALKYVANTVSKPENESEQQLQIAVKLLNKAIYGSYEITGPEQEVEEKEDPREQEFKNKTAKFESDRFKQAYTDVVGTVNTKLSNAVARDIDLKGTIPEYVKSKLVDDVLTALDKQLNSDTRFRSFVDKLWLKAKSSDYNSSAKKELQDALINKAKTVLPGIMRAKKAEAMKGLTVRSRKEKEDDTPKESRDNGNPKKKKVTSSSEDYRNKPKPGESARDFMMRD